MCVCYKIVNRKVEVQVQQLQHSTLTFDEIQLYLSKCLCIFNKIIFFGGMGHVGDLGCSDFIEQISFSRLPKPQNIVLK